MGDITVSDNNWNEWKNLVLNELKTLNTRMDTTAKEIVTIREAIAGLKIKSGIWGAIAGTIPVLIALAIWVLKP